MYSELEALWAKRAAYPFESLRERTRAERIEIVGMGRGSFGLRIIEPLCLPPPKTVWRYINDARPPGVLCRGYMFVHTTPVVRHA